MTWKTSKTLSTELGRVLRHGAATLGYAYGAGVHDLARVLRIPGTVNRKAGLQRMCRQVSASGTAFTLEALLDYVLTASTAIPVQAAPPVAHVVRDTAEGERPGDEFNRTTSWASLLERNGWTWARRHGNEDHWVRPGKTTEGISATTRDDGNLYVFSTDAGLPDNVPLSKLYIYAHYEHSGNMSAAAASLRKQGLGADRPQDDDFFEGYRVQQPRALSAPAQPQGAAEPKTGDAERTLRLTPLSQFVIRKVRWLWDKRAPLGEITLMPGREGVGKSLVLASLAAGITKGTLPGEFFGEPRAVIYCAAEDSWGQTIAPRMLAAGADMSMVYRLDVVIEDLQQGVPILPNDCGEVVKLALSVNAGCLMLDPIVSMINGQLDTYKAPELRRALQPLREAAEDARLGVLALAHFNKSTGVDTSSKVAGSRAWLEVARAAISIARLPVEEPDGDDQESFMAPSVNRCVVSQEKNNLGSLDLPHLMYEVTEVIMAASDGTASVGKVIWTGESPISATEAIEGRRKGQIGGNMEGIIAFVKKTYKTNGMMVSLAEIYDFFGDGLSETNIRQTLSRAVGKNLLQSPVRGMYRPPTKAANPPAGVPT